MKFKSDVELQVGLADKDGQLGTSGQILSSTGTQTNWITPNPGDITGVTAGTNMSGGGTSGTVTLNCTITNNNQLTNGSGYTTNTGTTTASNTQTFTNKSGNISQWTNDSGYITSSSLPTVSNAMVTVSTAAGLDGGTTFTLNQSANKTISLTLDLDELAVGGTLLATDHIVAVNGTASQKQLVSSIPLSIFSNNAGWTSNVGDITGVTAGNKLTGGGTSGTVTLGLASNNVSQWTNDSGYTTNVGDITGVTAGSGISGGGTSGTVTVTNSDKGSSQAIFKNVAVSGQSTVIADSNNDTLTLVAAGGMTITTDATTDTITFNPNDDNSNYYTTAAAFSTSTGIISFSGAGGQPAYSVDIDGRYVTTSGVTSVATGGTVSGLTLTGGTITSTGTITLGGTLALTSANVTTGLGFTPYNSTNPSGYTTNTGTTTASNTQTFTNKSGNISQWTNDSGYVTSSGGSMSSWILKEGNGVESTSVTNGETVTFAQGNGITSEMTSTTSGGTITITNTKPNIVQTTITGNAGSATVLQTARAIAGVSFNGSANISLNNNAITNGAGYTTNTGTTTASNTQTFTNKSGNISQWTNDAGYITSAGDITGVTAGTGLSGGGTSGTVTLTLDLGELAVGGTLIATDYLIAENGGVDNRQLISSIPLSIFNNNAGWTSNAGDITAVVAGTGMSGGGTSGSVTLNCTITNNNQLTNGSGYTTYAEPGIFSGAGTPTLASGVTAAEIRSLIGAGTSSSTGTVTSIATSTGLSGGTITTSGTLTNTDRGSQQNIFKNIAVSGQSTVVADNNNDTLTLVAAGGMTITTNALTDTITFNPNDDNSNYYTTAASFNTGNGIISFSGAGGQPAYSVDLDGRYATSSGVTSINFKTDGTALNVNSNTITSTGTMTGIWQGTSSQYVNGLGDLTTFPSIPQGDITAVVAGTGMSGGGTSGSVTLNCTVTGDTGVPAILSNGSTPTLNSGISAAEVRSLIGAGTSSSSGVTSVATSGSVSGITLTGGTITSTGTITLGGTLSLTSANVTTGLGFTPYNATNPAGYTTNTGTTTASNTQTFTNKSGNISQWTNDAGYITSAGDITGVTAGTGLSGGGTTGTVTLNLDLGELGVGGILEGTDYLVAENGGVDNRQLVSDIRLSAFNNNSGWTSNTGDITNVTAGVGMTGGGTSGSVSLAVGGGDGISVNNSSVYVDSTVVRTTGTQSIGGAKTFTSNVVGSGLVTFTAANFILSSDKRLKENIKELEPNNISAEWKSFNMKDSEGYRVGVVAQELEVSHPEFVETNDEGFKSVKYIDLLISKIAELEDRIKKLEK